MKNNKLSSFIVMDIVKKANKYKDVIHFEIGQPDLSPSKKVQNAIKNLDKNSFAYTQSNGILALRKKISKYYKKNYNVDIDTSRIFITPGTSGAFSVAYSLALGTKGVLGLTDPSYPCYKNFAYLLGIKPKFFNIDTKNNYQIRVKDIKDKNIDALMISSPSNPIGNLYKRKNLKELIKYSVKNNISFISDELYHGLTYDKKATTALEFSDEVYVANGFSKSFCLPGFRLGWLIVPKSKIREAEMIMQNLFISAPTISQYAALEAFDKKYLNKIKKTFKKRRDYLYDQLNGIFKLPKKPHGAFYIWADISKYGIDSFEFTKKLLKEQHVAVAPGIDFGTNKTNNFIRLSYTRDIKHMKIGILRIKSFIKNLK